MRTFRSVAKVEDKQGLRKPESLSTLKKTADHLTTILDLPPVEVEIEKEVEKKGLAGWFKPPNILQLAPRGLCKAVVIHEFAHYVDYLRRRKPGSHDPTFKRLHKAIVRRYLKKRE